MGRGWLTWRNSGAVAVTALFLASLALNVWARAHTGDVGYAPLCRGAHGQLAPCQAGMIVGIAVRVPGRALPVHGDAALWEFAHTQLDRAITAHARFADWLLGTSALLGLLLFGVIRRRRRRHDMLPFYCLCGLLVAVFRVQDEWQQYSQALALATGALAAIAPLT